MNRPISIRKCAQDCCVVRPHSNRFTLITFPDRTETVTSYGMAVESVRTYIRKAKQALESTGKAAS